MYLGLELEIGDQDCEMGLRIRIEVLNWGLGL